MPFNIAGIRDFQELFWTVLGILGKCTKNRSEPFLPLWPKNTNSSGTVLNRSEPFSPTMVWRTVLNRSWVV